MVKWLGGATTLVGRGAKRETNKVSAIIVDGVVVQPVVEMVGAARPCGWELGRFR